MPLTQAIATSALVDEQKQAEDLKKSVTGMHVQLTALAGKFIALNAQQSEPADLDALAAARTESITTLAGSVKGAGSAKVAVVAAFLDDLSAAIKA